MMALNTQTNMSFVIRNGNECLGLGPLVTWVCFCMVFKTSSLGGCTQEKVNDFRLLDGQGEEIDLLQRLYHHILDHAAQTGDRDPLLVLGLAPVSSKAMASHSGAPGASRPCHLLSFGIFPGKKPDLFVNTNPY